MKPEQARQILTEAADYISEWKEKLLVVSGNGIDIKDSSAGQVVLMGGPPGKAPLEPEGLQVYLWGEITLTKRVFYHGLQDSYYGTYFPSNDSTEVYESGKVILAPIEKLEAGDYNSYSDGEGSKYAEEAYNNPDDRESAGQGFTRLVYPDAWSIAPSINNSQYPGPDYPQNYPVDLGALHSQLSQDGFSGRVSPEVKVSLTMKLYIRAFTAGYSDYVLNKGTGERLDFTKGVGVGAYDLAIRQIGSKQGPNIPYPAYTDSDGVYHPAGYTITEQSTSESRKIRVGFTGNETSFLPQDFNNPYWDSPGTIEIVAYRKV